MYAGMSLYSRNGSLSTVSECGVMVAYITLVRAALC